MKSSPTAAVLCAILRDATDELADARAQLASTNPQNWRRLLLDEPKRRAKTIPLRDTNAANVPTVMRMNELAIAEQRAPDSGSDQCHHDVQQLSPNELEFMEVFDSLGTIVTAQRLADELGCTVKQLRWRELHDLQVKGVLESVRGARGGYRRIK